MGDIMYSKKLMELFRNPKNMGRIENADGVGRVGNPICLIPDTMIMKNPGAEKINKISVGDYAMTHEGLYSRVSKTFKRKYKGDILKIKNKLGATYITSEHLVLAIRVPKKHKFLYIGNKMKLSPEWHHAGELEKGDIILYPITKENNDTANIKIDTTRKTFDYKSKPVPESILLDNDFLLLCGYYLSEGYLREITTKTHTTFTFGVNEMKYADDVVRIVSNIFGLDAKKIIVKNHNAINVAIYNVFITRLFSRLFGAGASNKSIPHFMMLLPPEKQI